MIPVTYWPQHRGNYLWLQVASPSNLSQRIQRSVNLLEKTNDRTNPKCVICEGFVRDATNGNLRCTTQTAGETNCTLGYAQCGRVEKGEIDTVKKFLYSIHRRFLGQLPDNNRVAFPMTYPKFMGTEVRTRRPAVRRELTRSHAPITPTFRQLNFQMWNSWGCHQSGMPSFSSPTSRHVQHFDVMYSFSHGCPVSTTVKNGCRVAKSGHVNRIHVLVVGPTRSTHVQTWISKCVLWPSPVPSYGLDVMARHKSQCGRLIRLLKKCTFSLVWLGYQAQVSLDGGASPNS